MIQASAIGVSILALLAGCSSGPNAKYCKVWNGPGKALDFRDGIPFGLTGVIDTLEDMIAEAPAEVFDSLKAMLANVRDAERSSGHMLANEVSALNLSKWDEAYEDVAQKSWELCR